MGVERLYADVVGELERRADAGRAEKEMYYHKKVGAGLKCYRISAPEFEDKNEETSQTSRR